MKNCDIDACEKRELVSLLADCKEKLQQYFTRLAGTAGAIEYESGVPYPILIDRIDRAIKN